MTTNITLIYDPPVSVDAFEAGYPDLLQLARALPGRLRHASARVWPKEDGSAPPAHRLLDLSFADYASASLAVTTTQAAAFFDAAVALGTGGLRVVFTEVEPTTARPGPSTGATGPDRPDRARTDRRPAADEEHGTTTRSSTVEMKLEVVVVPVSDVDRAKQFYEGLGWRLDADFVTGPDFRVVQLTPPGSEAAVIFGNGVTDARPGSVQGLHLVVTDVEAAQADLLSRGVDVGKVFHDEDGVFHHAGTLGQVPGPHPERASYGSFASFADPDGNGWVLQEVTQRAPGR